MTKTLERHGLLIFSISILMVTQLRWAESRNYADIAQRLSASNTIRNSPHLGS